MDLKQARETFKDLTDRLRAYQYVLALSDWDLTTYAPNSGKGPAAKARGFLAGEAFAIQTSPQMREVLETYQAHKSELTEVEAREIELLDERMEKLLKIPKEEYQAFEELKSVSQMVWEQAKEQSDFSLFSPYLERVVNYTRRFAKLTKPDMHPYDACLGDYEKGLCMADLDVFFDAVREKTVPLVAKIQKEGREIRTDFLTRTYPVDQQDGVSRKLLQIIGFDLESGRLAVSEHPFTSTINPSDIRMTTHYYENNLASALFSTLHEGGHGIYDQKVHASPIVQGTTLEEGASMSFHESQSRFFENFVGKSRSFWKFAYPMLQDAYPKQLGDVGEDEFYRAVNVAKPGFIRIEADELTYNLHIMVRYELEKLLITEQVGVADLPRLWNQKYEEYLGITPQSDKMGVLQDVHWSGGMIGYFPSYALGNAYGAQIYNVMKRDLKFEELCQTGDIAPICDWLYNKVHQYGALKTPTTLIQEISGEKLNPAYLTDYLEQKFSEIYF